MPCTSTRLAALAAGALIGALAIGAAVPPALASTHTTTAALSLGQRVSPHVMGLHRKHAGSKQQSLNWSGYVRDGHGFTSIRATWKVPTVTTTHDGYSSTWVGIDGATSGDRYLIQTGTEADVSGGRRSYDAWWEVITPNDEAPETVFSGFTVAPGDSISASVYRTSAGRWTMRLTDNTRHHTASHTAAFAGPGKSAEWIQEDTDVNGYISTAPDWHAVQFTRCALNGANPKLTSSEAVDIVDSHGTREASTGAPTSAGSGFTVSWLAPGTRTSAGQGPEMSD